MELKTNILTFVEKLIHLNENLVVKAPMGSNIMSGFYLLDKYKKEIAFKIISPIPFDFSKDLKNKISFPKEILIFNEEWFFSDKTQIDRIFKKYCLSIEEAINDIAKENKKNKFLAIFNFFALSNLNITQLQKLKELFLRANKLKINLIFTSPAEAELSQEEKAILSILELHYKKVQITPIISDSEKNKLLKKLVA